MINYFFQHWLLVRVASNSGFGLSFVDALKLKGYLSDLSFCNFVSAGHLDDEGRSLDSLPGGMTPLRNGSDSDPTANERSGSAADQRPPTSTNSYPPDLLAFPSR